MTIVPICAAALGKGCAPDKQGNRRALRLSQISRRARDLLKRETPVLTAECIFQAVACFDTLSRTHTAFPTLFAALCRTCPFSAKAKKVLPPVCNGFSLLTWTVPLATATRRFPGILP